MAKKIGSTTYKGRVITKYHGKPPGARYLSDRMFFKIAGVRRPDHFDYLEDAKAWVRTWEHKQIKRDKPKSMRSHREKR